LQEKPASIRSYGRTLLPNTFRYRGEGRLLLHAFVVMPNHVHLLLTVPEALTLERVMQFVKGGFSHEAGKSIGSGTPFWQKRFVDR
jgi:putative transposase